MTPDDLEDLVLDPKDYWPLQRALAPLAEKERAKLSLHAQKLHTQLSRNKLGENASDRLKAYFRTYRQVKGWHVWNADSNRCATLALFGLCPVSALKKRGIFVFHQEQPIFERIIEDRRPAWLDDWIAYSLDDEFPHLSFPALRRWIKSGLCKKPAVDGYYQLFAAHLMRTPRHNSDEVVPPLSQQLLDGPDLLDDIDGLFRVETIAFNTNSWLTRGAPKNYETWPDALVKLSGQRHLDRGHLLANALEGLRLDIKQNQLSGYHALYRRLAPTTEERLHHQPDYIALLCHPVGHVAKFALDMLSDIDKDRMLDTAQVLGELPLVLIGESKGNATAALKLIGRIIGRKDAFEALALGTTCEALRHASADVQGQALTLLEKHAARLSRAQLELLGDLEAFVTASNRQRLSALLSARQMKAAPAPIRAVDRNSAPYAVISPDINDQRILFTEDRITPIASVDELIDALFHAVEVVESPDEVERIIDAIGRFAGDRPADFAARIAPLLHRQRSQTPSNKGLIVVPFGIGGALRDLLGTWISGRLVNTARKPESYETSHEGFVPLSAHLGELARRVAQGHASVLLSTPTHKGGWIDPLVWVERLKQTSSNDVATTMDLRLSLLRLAPDNRREALAALDGMPEVLRRIAAFALGGDEMPGKADRGDYAAWISAARCRAPYKDWRAEFATLNLADAWMDSLVPAHYGWQSGHTKHRFQDQSVKFPKFDITTNAVGAEAPEKSSGFLAALAQTVSSPLSTSWEVLPSAALVRGIDQDRHWHTQYELHAVWVTQWLAYIWPQNPSAVYMKAAKGLATNLDEPGSTWGPRFGFFYALFQRSRPWRQSGHLLLCLGLAARDADVKGLAVDALIEGIDGRLFDPDLFATTVTRVAEGEWLKLNRMGESLMTTAQVSYLHAEVIGRAVQKWLPTFDHRQTGGFAILEVLLEVQAVTGEPLQAEAKAHLGTITGSSKVAKIAQQLLKRDATS